MLNISIFIFLEKQKTISKLWLGVNVRIKFGYYVFLFLDILDRLVVYTLCNNFFFNIAYYTKDKFEISFREIKITKKFQLICNTNSPFFDRKHFKGTPFKEKSSLLNLSISIKGGYYPPPDLIIFIFVMQNGRNINTLI